MRPSLSRVEISEREILALIKILPDPPLHVFEVSEEGILFARGDPPETVSMEVGEICRIVPERCAGSGSLLERCDSALGTSDCERTIKGFEALDGGSARVVIASDELKDLVVLFLVVRRHLGPFRERFRIDGILIISRWLFVVRLVFH